MSRLVRDQSLGSLKIPAFGGLAEEMSGTSVPVVSPPAVASPSAGPSPDQVEFEGIPCPGEIPTVANGTVYQIAKRGLDIVGAIVGMVLSAPLMAVCAVFIKLHDGGQILFAQTRVGRGGRLFRVYKFRSMVPNADALKVVLMDQNRHSDNRTFKILNDPRITPIGRVMRRLSLDELPQFWNVLRGDMSLVGPRPPLPAEVELYQTRDLMRLAVKPGITCLWQVSGRSNLDFACQVELDLRYVQQRGVWTDLKLLVRTFPAVFRGDGAA
jgi:lipopolysaccharide/colanic/teichoic acid biosynthesis glycosyltransferase